jgi:hypothetical protein
MRPVDFWQLTYAEFFPLYEHVVGEVYKPLSKEEFLEQEAEWTNGVI